MKGTGGGDTVAPNSSGGWASLAARNRSSGSLSLSLSPSLRRLAARRDATTASVACAAPPTAPHVPSRSWQARRADAEPEGTKLARRSRSPHFRRRRAGLAAARGAPTPGPRRCASRPYSTPAPTTPRAVLVRYPSGTRQTDAPCRHRAGSSRGARAARSISRRKIRRADKDVARSNGRLELRRRRHQLLRRVGTRRGLAHAEQLRLRVLETSSPAQSCESRSPRRLAIWRQREAVELEQQVVTRRLLTEQHAKAHAADSRRRRAPPPLSASRRGPWDGGDEPAASSGSCGKSACGSGRGLEEHGVESGAS